MISTGLTVEVIALKGDANAQNNLSAKHEAGEIVRQDYAKAVEWFQNAANQGDSTAQYNLALMYYDGKGTSQKIISMV